MRSSKTLPEKVKIQKSVGIMSEASFLSAIFQPYKKKCETDTICWIEHDPHLKGYHKDAYFMH